MRVAQSCYISSGEALFEQLHSVCPLVYNDQKLEANLDRK